MEPSRTKSYNGRFLEKGENLLAYELFTQRSIFVLILIIIQNSKIELLKAASPSAKTAQIVSFKVCKNKNKKSQQNLYKPFQSLAPFTSQSLTITRSWNAQCSYFIMLAKPRIKHRIISRWCPLFVQIIQFSVVLKALVI